MTVEQAMRQVRLHAEKRELARRAQMAEKLAAVGTMTAGLSHEIRNPLNAAALQLSVLERRVQRLPPDAQAPLLEPLTLVKDEIRRLDHILEDFLQFARPREFVPRAGGGGVGGAPRARPPRRRGRAARRPARARRRGVPAVAGDEERLRQVLVNLGLNALEAVRDGGRVRVSCRLEAPAGPPEPGVEVLVDDDGARRPGRGARPDLRALLHHQGQGLRARPLDRPRHRDAARRADPGGGLAGGRRAIRGEPAPAPLRRRRLLPVPARPRRAVARGGARLRRSATGRQPRLELHGVRELSHARDGVEADRRGVPLERLHHAPPDPLERDLQWDRDDRLAPWRERPGAPPPRSRCRPPQS